nr:hypothetical protein [Tanacetum cinerariifolium]
MIFNGMLRNLDSHGKFLMYPRFIQTILNIEFPNHELPNHEDIYVFNSHTKKVFSNMKRIGQPTDAHHTPSFDTQPPQPKKKTQKPKEAKKKTTKVPQPSRSIDFTADEAVFKKRRDCLGKAATTTSSLEAEQDSEDELKKSKITYKIKVDDLKKRVKKLERKNESRTHKLKRLYKVRLTTRVESSSDEEPALNDEDASKHGRNIDEIDANDEITLIAKIIVEEVRAASNQEVGAVNEPVSAALTIVTTAQPTKATKISVETIQTPTRKGITLKEPNAELAKRMLEEEQQQLIVKEKSKLFAELIEKIRKFFTRNRAKEKMNKPPTKTQQRKNMSTYLKNMEGCRINKLKHLDFNTLKKKFDIVFKRVNTFLDMDTEFVEGKKEKKAEGSSKRIRDELEQDDAKKPKMNDNAKETKEKEKGLSQNLESWWKVLKIFNSLSYA